MKFTANEVPYTDKDLITFLGQQQSQHIAWGNAYADDLADYLTEGDLLTGACLPWSYSHANFRMRSGEVTLWGGMNGHHKSMILGQVMQWIALAGDSVGIMSFEMPVLKTMKRMVKQASGSVNPTSSFGRAWALWNENNISYYDKLDTTPSAEVLGAVYYMAKDLGVKHIMIDSLTKCGLPYGERAAEKSFIDALCATAKAFDIHIHLVAHVRKPASGGEEHIPSKFDVRGAGELTDLVDNVVLCWHDKRKDKIYKIIERQGEDSLSASDKKYMEECPDQRLIIAKQRNSGYEGTIALYKLPCLQFTQDKGRIIPFPLPTGIPSDQSGEC